MAALLALLSAAIYGAADFLGGTASRRATVVATVVVSQAAGVVLLLAALPWLPAASVRAADVAWGATAGLAGGVGVALLYRALAIGPMSLVAPLTAACAAAVPVAAGLWFGERLTTATGAGIVLAGAAIVLVGQARPSETAGTQDEGASPHARGGICVALAAGVAVGLFFVALARTRPDAGLWPLVAARAVSIVLFAAIALATRQPLLVTGSVLWIAIAGGALDMLANALYLVAVQRGPLNVIATLASLYPASTILLARVVLRERLSRLQVAGIVCALAATALLVAGTG